MASATAVDARRIVAAHPLAMATTLGVGLRLIWLLLGSGRDRLLMPDSIDYLDLSDRLSVYSGSGSGGSYPLQLLSLYRPPVYPVFVWLTSFGHPDQLITVILAQILLGGLVNVALCYCLGALLGGRRVAVVAAVLLAIDPSSIAHSLLIASETLTTTLVLLGLVALAEARTRPSIHARAALAAVAGLALVLSSLTRPVLVYVIPLLVIVALFTPRPTGQQAGSGDAAEPERDLATGRRGRSWAMAGALLAGALLPAAAWIARNQALTGRPLYSTVQGENLTLYGLGSIAAERGEIRLNYQVGGGNNPAVVVPDEALVERADRRALADLGVMDADAPNITERSTPEYAAAADAALSDEGMRMLRAHPRGAVMLGVYGTGRILLAPGASGNLAQLRPAFQVAPVRAAVWVWAVTWVLVVDVGAAAGLVILARRRKWWDAALLAVPAGYYVAASAGTFAYLRFRIPISPLLCILAAVSLVALLDARRAPQG